MEIELKRGDVYALANAIAELINSKTKLGAKFNYALNKTFNLLTPEIRGIESFKKENFKEFNIAKEAILKKKEANSDELLKALSETHKEDFEKYNNFQNELVKVHVHQILVEEIPDGLDGTQLAVLMPMIKD